MLRPVLDKLLQQTRREYQPKQRMLALALEGVFFLIILPFALINLGAAVDRWTGWPVIVYPPVNAVLGCLVALGSWLFGAWSVYVQFTIGRGTPVPMMATQRLIIQPPYSYCRNPMALGAIGMYLGVAVIFGSFGALFLVMLGAGLLLSYIKLFEEKEMAARFGPEYLAYKQQTPFLIPRFRK